MNAFGISEEKEENMTLVDETMTTKTLCILKATIKLQIKWIFVKYEISIMMKTL